MADLFSSQSEDSGITIEAGQSGWLNPADISWQDSGCKGFWIKPLFEDKSRHLKTWLMKVDPGAYSPLHDHAELEQAYVLQGSFYDQGNVYQAGEYILRAPGVMDIAGSEERAIVILFYSPVSDLTNQKIYLELF